jgi:short chain enoyl-CoA hydratase (EC 4.2.1.17)
MELKYENIIVEIRENIGIIKINRPAKLNALNRKAVEEIIDALEKFERNDEIKVIIITGENNFSVGADINELINLSPLEAMEKSPLAKWEKYLNFISKPLIAAIKGYAVGGGLEIALSCDIIIAGEKSMIGQPEINLGLMPGAGGTQRLARTIGKYKTMELVLTGRLISAKEALELGLINKVVPDELVLDEAIKIAKEISKRPSLAIKLIKESVNTALETSLKEGLNFERKLFYLLLSTEDAKEGMKAFLEKREPKFIGK